MMRTSCPKCGSSIRIKWSSNAPRALEDRCNDNEECGWTSEPYIPSKRKILTTRNVGVGFGCWEYEIFDQYGYPAVCSEGFDTEKECCQAAREELTKLSNVEGYGKCTAIIWPPSVKVKGKILK